MARRERGNEQIFGIVGVGVAAEHRIGAADDVGLAVDLKTILPSITLISRCAGAEVAVPDEASFIIVRVLPAGGFSHVTLRGMKCVRSEYLMNASAMISIVVRDAQSCVQFRSAASG